MNRTALPHRLLPAVACLAGLIFFTGCVVSRDPITGEKDRYGYSWAEEVELGREADGQIMSQYGVYDDDDLAAYVDSLGQALVSRSHLRREGAEAEWINTPFFFRILDSPVVNAFALPGGYVYVTRGLLAHAENEAQLAVVIGHEIGHVAARHASKRAKNQMLSQAALIAGAVGGQLLIGGNTAQAVLNYGGVGAELLMLSYSRSDESQSDKLGVEYASLSGYKAAEGSGFFRTLKRLSDQSGQSIPTFLQTHPDPGQREIDIVQEAALWTVAGQAERVGRSWYLEHVDELVYGENPRQGFVHEGRFVHPDLAFQFDVADGFNVVNQPAQVVLISEDERAAARLTIDSDHTTATAAADAFEARQGITIIDRGGATVNGLSMRFVVAETQVENAEAIRFRIQFVEYNGNVFSFLGFTGSSDFAAYDLIFKPMLRSFRPLTDRALLATEAKRIRVQKSSRSGPFQSLAGIETNETVSANTLAILNQLELSDVVAQGYAYKAVR